MAVWVTVNQPSERLRNRSVQPCSKRTLIRTASVTSHSHIEHGHRKIIAILDVAVAVFQADMEDVKYAHPPTEAKPDSTDVWLLITAHCGTRK